MGEWPNNQVGKCFPDIQLIGDNRLHLHCAKKHATSSSFWSGSTVPRRIWLSLWSLYWHWINDTSHESYPEKDERMNCMHRLNWQYNDDKTKYDKTVYTFHTANTTRVPFCKHIYTLMQTWTSQPIPSKGWAKIAFLLTTSTPASWKFWIG